MSKLPILVIFLLITAVQVIAQPAINSNIQQFTTDNGLPSNGIKGLQWDEETGFLWMASEAGIVRFNGVDFKSYTKQNMPAITSERMLFMVKNNAGKIYTSDQPGNVFVIDKSNPVPWRKAAVMQGINPEVGSYYLLGISELFFQKKINTAGSRAFASNFVKLICISDTACIIQTGNRFLYQSISMNDAVNLAFVSGKFNNIFKIGNRVFVLNDKEGVFPLTINVQDPANTLVTTAGSAFKPQISNSRLYWQTGMENPVLLEGNKAWILYDNGTSVNTRLICDNIPQDSYIASVQYSEKNNLLFIGTESKGLIVINQNRVLSKKRNYLSKGRNSYYSQIELPNGNILTGESDVIGDNMIDTGKLSIKGKFSFNVSQTNENTLWFYQTDPGLGYGCMHRYNKTTGEIRAYPKIRTDYMVAVSGDRTYFAGQNDIGVLDGDSLSVLYKYPKNLAGTTISGFTEVSPGILLIASCGGLLRFNTATRQLDKIFSEENICVRTLWKYKDYVFFGTYGSGFYMYRNAVIKSMPLDKNRYLLYTHCFVPDDEGYCWISTNRGLFKASLAELVDAFENNRSSVYYHYFGKKDGMEMTELNGGCAPCALRMKNKTISFPTMDGLLWVNPDQATPMLPAGEIFIDEILIDNVKMNKDSIDLKKLPPQTQEIIFQLGFSAWCNKENIYLDYQLNDTLHWKAINTDNEAAIRLGNLAPGKYVLRIRKLNGFGINNYSYKEIRFTISTPWNKQWWFYVLISLAALGLTAFYLRLRTRQYKIRQRRLEWQVAEKTKELLEKNEVLEKNNTIKTRLISIISHDIVTPLKFVTVAGKNLIEKRNLMSEELQQETIQEMTNTSQELQLLSTNILNWIKYQNENRRLAKETFNVHELVDQVLGVLHSLANQKKLVLLNEVNNDLEIRQYFEPLKILVYNLLTNAINFSERSNITISAQSEDEQVVISVQDEGVGMTPEQIKNIMADQFIISSANVDNRKGNGLGYLIIKDLVKMMDATLHISSEKGKGTTVSVHLPVTKDSRIINENL